MSEAVRERPVREVNLEPLPSAPGEPRRLIVPLKASGSRPPVFVVPLPQNGSSTDPLRPLGDDGESAGLS